VTPVFALAQLRHLYKNLLDRAIGDQTAAARNLLGPAIEALEADAAGASAAKWEADHQRAALERHGLMDLFMGCDSIDVVCERLVAARAQVAEERERADKAEARLAARISTTTRPAKPTRGTVSPIVLDVPLALKSGANLREHWRQRAARVKAERDAVSMTALAAKGSV
jgi:hypothetical protein